MSKFIHDYRQILGSTSISLSSLGLPRYCRILSITSDVHLAGSYVDTDIVKGTTGVPPRFPLASSLNTVNQVFYDNFIIGDDLTQYYYTITYASVGAFDCYLLIEYEDIEPENANKQPVIIEERTRAVQYKGGIIHS